MTDIAAPPVGASLRDVLEAIRARHCADLWQTVAKLPREDRAVAAQYAIESGFDPRYPELPDMATVLGRLAAQAAAVDAGARVRRFSDIPPDVVVDWYQAVLDTAALVRAQPPEIQAFTYVTAFLGCRPLRYDAAGVATDVKHGWRLAPSSGASYHNGQRVHPGTYLARMRERSLGAGVAGHVTVYMDWEICGPIWRAHADVYEPLWRTDADFYAAWRTSELEVLGGQHYSRGTWTAQR